MQQGHCCNLFPVQTFLDVYHSSKLPCLRLASVWLIGLTRELSIRRQNIDTSNSNFKMKFITVLLAVLAVFSPVVLSQKVDPFASSSAVETAEEADVFPMKNSDALSISLSKSSRQLIDIIPTSLCKKFTNYIADDGVTTLFNWCESLGDGKKCCSTGGVVGQNDECVGWSTQPDTVYEVCENSCNGKQACQVVARNAGNGSSITFEKGSCSSSEYSCTRMATASVKKVNIRIGENSCSNYGSCAFMAVSLFYFESIVIGSSSCIKEYSCYQMGFQASNLKSIAIGSSSCSQKESCREAASQAKSLKQTSIDANQCNSIDQICRGCGSASTFNEALLLTEECCEESGDSGTACQYSEPSVSPSISNHPSLSTYPSYQPSSIPSSMPSKLPSTFPSDQPSSIPSLEPSEYCEDEPGWNLHGWTCESIKELKNFSRNLGDVCQILSNEKRLDKSVFEACCVCGGSINIRTPSLSPIPSQVPTISLQPSISPFPTTTRPQCGNSVCELECGSCPSDCSAATDCGSLVSSASEGTLIGAMFGQAFDVDVFEDIYFHEIEAWFYAFSTPVTFNVMVYTKEGSYAESINLNDYTLVFEGIFTASSPASGLIGLPFTEIQESQQNTVRSFYITCNIGSTSVFASFAATQPSNDDISVGVTTLRSEASASRMGSVINHGLGDTKFLGTIKYGYIPSPPQTSRPTLSPSSVPSSSPSDSTEAPSTGPSSLPSELPSMSTDKPSLSPSSVPSSSPTDSTEAPSTLPSSLPSEFPSMSTDKPSTSSDAPSLSPSSVPSEIPSNQPSLSPSASLSPTFISNNFEVVIPVLIEELSDADLDDLIIIIKDGVIQFLAEDLGITLTYEDIEVEIITSRRLFKESRRLQDYASFLVSYDGPSANVIAIADNINVGLDASENANLSGVAVQVSNVPAPTSPKAPKAEKTTKASKTEKASKTPKIATKVPKTEKGTKAPKDTASDMMFEVVEIEVTGDGFTRN